MSNSNSYRQILRSSSIMGSAQAISYLVGLVRVKIVALILGPTGVGLIGIYTSAVTIVGSVTGLGVWLSQSIVYAADIGQSHAGARFLTNLVGYDRL